MTRAGAVLCSLLALCASACGDGGPEPVHLSAAVSLTETIDEVVRAWEARGGTPVVANVAASNVLARQIEEGAPVDLFVSADRAQVDRLVEAGLVSPADRVPLLSNQLVVIVPSGRPLDGAAPAALAAPGVERVALGDPAAVPAGVYAKAWLKKAGVWDEVAPKVVPSSSVRAALAAVAAANADAAIVYATDLQGSRGVQVAYRVPAGEGPSIVYPAALVAGLERREAAGRLLAFMQGPEATAIFERAGFEPLAARGNTPAAFGWRCIPPGGVAPRSSTPGILTRPPSFAANPPCELRRGLAEALAEAGRALPGGRIATHGATLEFHHGLPASRGAAR